MLIGGNGDHYPLVGGMSHDMDFVAAIVNDRRRDLPPADIEQGFASRKGLDGSHGLRALSSSRPLVGPVGSIDGVGGRGLLDHRDKGMDPSIVPVPWEFIFDEVGVYDPNLAV